MLSVNTVRAAKGRGTAFGARWQPAINRQPTSSDRIVCDMNASARSRVREASVLVLTNKVELRGQYHKMVAERSEAPWSLNRPRQLQPALGGVHSQIKCNRCSHGKGDLGYASLSSSAKSRPR